MSLDVYLRQEGVQNLRGRRDLIFIRENGSTREISREEWDKRFPDREPITCDLPDDGEEVFSGNITHNLNSMADEAGIYDAMWRPDEIGVKTAAQLIPLLKSGLELLRADPVRFQAHNPKNGWGSYEGLVRFVENYLAACKEYPDAEVSVSR